MIKNTRRIATPRLNGFEYQRFIDSVHKKCYIETENDGGSVIKIIKKHNTINKLIIKSDVTNKRTAIYPEDVAFWEPYSYIVGIDEYGWADEDFEDYERNDE